MGERIFTKADPRAPKIGRPSQGKMKLPAYVQTHDCPVCGVAPGEPCFNPRTGQQWTSATHAARNPR
jgi:hypothetical protein